MSDGRCEFRFQPSGNRCQKPIHPGEESHLWQIGVNESLAQQGMNVDHDPAKSLLKPLPPRDSEPHGWKEVQREVTGTSSEKAELQVSLLNEIGLTLTAVAKAQVLAVRMFESLQRDVEQLRKWLDPTSDTTGVHSEFNYLTSMCAKTSDKVSDVADTLGIHKLSLEGIQGLLVDNEAGIGTLGEGIAAILARLDHDSIAGLSQRLGRIEERLDKFDVWFDSWNELRAAALEAGQMEIRQMQAKQRTSSGAEANNQKPRKAGKRKRVKR